MSELHKIVSFWDGKKPLHYIHHISLLSFVDLGHEVDLFTLNREESELEVPRGVKLRYVDEISEGLSQKMLGLLPATAADLLRILLLDRFDAIWVDTDVYCLKPFTKDLTYLFAHEGTDKIKSPMFGNINNAVVGLPKNSVALSWLVEFSEINLQMRQNCSSEVTAYIETGGGHAILKYGPRALTYFLQMAGEFHFQSNPKALYPIHFNVSDCYWDPLVNVSERFDNTTIATHFWDSQVRNGWYRRRALKGSFMWKVARKHDVNMERLRRRR